MKRIHRYVVRAICTGTIRERWIVTANCPLTEDEIRDSLCGGCDPPEGVSLDCTDEETADETDREIESIEEAD